MITNFRHEVINGERQGYVIRDAFTKFMIKRKELCRGKTWRSQNKNCKLRYFPLGHWGFTNMRPTITMKDFLVKYSKKKINFKTIMHL